MLEPIKETRGLVHVKPELISKPWGREEILARNDKYVVKRLVMKNGHQCSMQYHRYKRETIISLKGELTIVQKNAEIILKPGEVVTIEPYQQHRMAARGGDSVYLECSTTELDDVVRLNDDYGRI